MNIDYNPLECPYCKKKAAEYFEIIIGQSRLHRKKECLSCMKKIKFNLKAIGKSYLSAFIIIIAISLIESLISVNKWFGGILIFSGFFVPFILGQKLFLKQNEINPT